MSSPTLKPDASAGHSIASSMPSSAFLLARLETLRTSLLEHFQYILEISQSGAKVMQISRDPATDRVHDESVEVDETRTPSLAQTKMDQVRMDVEVEALVKNCEDLLALSRVLKEGWIFGGLDTIKKPSEKEQANKVEDWKKARGAMAVWLRQYFEKKGEKSVDMNMGHVEET